MTAVLVTRPSNEASPLVRALRATAIRVHVVPTIELAPVPARSPAGRRVRGAFRSLRSADWVVVTSRYGAAVAARHLLLADGQSYAPVRWAAIGSGATDALTAAGIQPDVSAPVSDPYTVIGAMTADGRLTNRRVLLARSDLADRSLHEVIAGTGARVHDIATYRTIEGPSSGRSALRNAIADPDLRAIVVASGSAARGLVRMLGHEPTSPRVGTTTHLESARAIPTVTIGPATTAVARSAGLRVAAQADEPTVAGIVRAVSATLTRADSGRPAQFGGFDR